MLSLVPERCATLFDILVPIRCALCGAHGAHICARCREDLEAAALVSRPSAKGVPGVRALGPYAGALREAVLGLKFRNRRAAAMVLSAILARRLGDDAEAIVPVPLHGRRLLARGFNQAESVALGIAAVKGIPCLGRAVTRIRATTAQSSLPLRERRGNVLDAFRRGPDAGQVRGRRVLIVDDVVTTGETMAACARVLYQAGARWVEAAALAIRF